MSNEQDQSQRDYELIQHLQSQLSTITKERDEANLRRSETILWTDELQKELTDANAECETLRIAVQLAGKDVSDAKAQWRELHEQLQSIADLVADKLNLSTPVRGVPDPQTLTTAVQATLADAKAEVERLLDGNARVIVERDSALSTINSMKHSHDEYTRNVEMSLELYTHEIEGLKKEVEALLAEVTAKKEALQILMERFDSHKEESKSTIAQLTAERDAMTKCRDVAVSTWVSKDAEYSKQFVALTSKLNTLQTGLTHPTIHIHYYDWLEEIKKDAFSVKFREDHSRNYQEFDAIAMWAWSRSRENLLVTTTEPEPAPDPLCTVCNKPQNNREHDFKSEDCNHAFTTEPQEPLTNPSGIEKE